MTLYRDRYRIESARRPEWHYRTPGWYFVTIVTRQRVPWFGEVVGGTVHLSALGLLAHRCWVEIRAHIPGVAVDAFVVMPDHVHGLIGIRPGSGAEHAWPHPVPAAPPVACATAALSTAVATFKAGVSRGTDAEEFAWQTRSHDRIIRSPAALAAARRYIAENPWRWQPPS